MAWPKEVPILTARDIYQGGLDGPRNTHCLYGWLGVVFGEATVPPKLFEKIRKECGTVFIAEFNDSKSKALVAKTWNRAMAKCGYVVGNPEAK